MNKWCGTGRITKDPELQLIGDKNLVKFTIAVARPTNKDESDFINCTVWNQPAKFLNQWVRKGDLLGIEGSIQTGSYQAKTGQTVYTTEIVVSRLEILSSNNNKQHQTDTKPAPIEHTETTTRKEVPTQYVTDDDLPF